MRLHLLLIHMWSIDDPIHNATVCEGRLLLLIVICGPIIVTVDWRIMNRKAIIKFSRTPFVW